MTTIMFCKHLSPSRDNFLRLIEMTPSLQNVVLCEDFQHLSHAIKTMICINTVALFIIDTCEEMKTLLQYRDCLNQMQLIIVTGQGMNLYMLNEYKLYPRYIAHHNGNWDEINDVLKHIINKIKVQEAHIETQQRKYERTGTDSLSI